MGLNIFLTSQGSNEYDVYAKVRLLTIESELCCDPEQVH